MSPRREKYPVMLSKSRVTVGIVDSANDGSPPGSVMYCSGLPFNPLTQDTHEEVNESFVFWNVLTRRVESYSAY